MGEAKEGKFPVWLAVVAVVVILANVVYLALPDGKAEVDLTGINTKIDNLATATNANTAAIGDLKKVDTGAVSNQTAEVTSPGTYTLTKGEYEDQAIEDEALRLATESVNSRDFRKAALEALEDFNITEVESYKDITVKIVETDVDEDEVTFDVKITYLIDGDEEETDKARLKEFTVKVDDLDYDEQFEDAEVDETYLDSIEVLRVYD